MLLLPPWLAIRMTRGGPGPLARASVQVLAVVVVMYAIDCLPSGMTNPIFTLFAGALGAVSVPAKRIYNSPLTTDSIRLIP